MPLAKWASPPQVLELQQTLAQKDQALGKLEQSLHLMEEASYDGTFLWKITNVTRRCHESACGRTVSLFSPGNSSRDGKQGADTGGAIFRQLASLWLSLQQSGFLRLPRDKWQQKGKYHFKQRLIIFMASANFFSP